MATAGRHQGRAGAVRDAVVLRRAVRRPVGAIGRAGGGRRRAVARPGRYHRRAAGAGGPDRGAVGSSGRSRIPPARRGARDRRGARRRAGQGGGARPRQVPRRLSRHAVRGRRRAGQGAGERQAGARLCRHLYRRRLSPRGRRQRGVDGPAGLHLVHGAGRVEPLLQGADRQAGRQRPRLSRRPLQVGGGAVPAHRPEPGVARGDRRGVRLAARPVEGRDRPGAAQGAGRRLSRRPAGAGRQGQWRFRQAQPGHRHRRPARRPAGVRQAGGGAGGGDAEPGGGFVPDDQL